MLKPSIKPFNDEWGNFLSIYTESSKLLRLPLIIHVTRINDTNSSMDSIGDMETQGEGQVVGIEERECPLWGSEMTVTVNDVDVALDI